VFRCLGVKMLELCRVWVSLMQCMLELFMHVYVCMFLSLLLVVVRMDA
jgi:hypothetical protein